MRKAVLTAKEDLGVKCPKYTGVVTVEYLQRALSQQGIATSPANVFIEGLPIEIDLIVPKEGATPKHGSLYKPEDVVAALEVKFYGAFGTEALDRLQHNLKKIQSVNRSIWCAYVTLMERQTWWTKTKEHVTLPAYCLFWHDSNGPDYISTGNWREFVGELKRQIGGFRSQICDGSLWQLYATTGTNWHHCISPLCLTTPMVGSIVASIYSAPTNLVRNGKTESDDGDRFPLTLALAAPVGVAARKSRQVGFHPRLLMSR